MLASPHKRVRLGKAVGHEQPNTADDIAAIQQVLDGMGQYHLKNGRPGQHDERLWSSLRGVQRRFGLKADGIAQPGGPTEYLLNALHAGGLTALAPDRARTPDRDSFHRQLLLRRPVGEGGGNDPDDEDVVRHGLVLLGDLPLGAVVPGNHLPPGALGDGIERFNRRRGLPPGRRVDPGSPAAVRLAKELGIAFADKLPDAAPADGPSATDRHGGGPRPLADKQKGKVTGDRPGAAYWGEYGSEPVVGALDDADFRRRIVQITGVEIPEKRNNERMRREWVPFSGALKDAGLGPDAQFAMLQTFAWEGGTSPDLDEYGNVEAVAGIYNSKELPRYMKSASIPAGTKVENLTNRQRAAFYKAYFNWEYQALRRTGGIATLDKIGDHQVAAAVGDTLVRGGGDTIEQALQKSIYETLEQDPSLAASLSELRRGSDGPDRPGSTEARIAVDGDFGPDSLRALQVIAASPTGKRAFLDILAEQRIAFHKHKLGKLSQGDLDRYDYFRFQCPHGLVPRHFDVLYQSTITHPESSSRASNVMKGQGGSTPPEGVW